MKQNFVRKLQTNHLLTQYLSKILLVTVFLITAVSSVTICFAVIFNVLCATMVAFHILNIREAIIYKSVAFNFKVAAYVSFLVFLNKTLKVKFPETWSFSCLMELQSHLRWISQKCRYLLLVTSSSFNRKSQLEQHIATFTTHGRVTYLLHP